MSSVGLWATAKNTFSNWPYEILDASIVVVAAGIRPNVDLGIKAGLKVNRGIVVNDHMETNLPDVFAVGECVEHRGVCYGLVAPLFDQGKVLAATITGNKGPTYTGTVQAERGAGARKKTIARDTAARTIIFALKGPNTSAQGNALGSDSRKCA